MVDVTEKFGAWVLNTRAGLIFGAAVFVLSAWVLFRMFFGSVVILNAKQFECAMSAPDGLGTKCVEYTVRKH